MYAPRLVGGYLGPLSQAQLSAGPKQVNYQSGGYNNAWRRQVEAVVNNQQYQNQVAHLPGKQRLTGLLQIASGLYRQNGGVPKPRPPKMTASQRRANKIAKKALTAEAKFQRTNAKRIQKGMTPLPRYVPGSYRTTQTGQVLQAVSQQQQQQAQQQQVFSEAPIRLLALNPTDYPGQAQDTQNVNVLISRINALGVPNDDLRGLQQSLQNATSVGAVAAQLRDFLDLHNQ